MGKLVGGIIGFVIGFIPGAILGVILGHLFDKGYAANMRQPSQADRDAIGKSFFETTFTLLGYLAKADGRVSEAEVAQTEQLMTQMGLTAEQRREAIALFKAGSAKEFDPKPTMAAFRAQCGRRHNLVQMLLSYLVNLALADGSFDASEERVLREIAAGLGINGFAFEQILKMIKAQNSFAGGGYRQGAGGGSQSSPNALAEAYDALGVESSATDAEVKRAYRKLMSQYHPDKLAGQGLPEDAVKAATERSKEIQVAYDLIKKSRA
ncbi:co-chaperone DjlA [Gilvimarinus chinensis]|uniref:co-chaperone DjlA n=1 Tax=Gilvimarinus chinensis TaxID=396005 RepID=UPI00035E65A6|nr:co-chaperone DjlA [Gilvimarinus chinensis]